MADKLKIKPNSKSKLSEFEIEINKWNLQTRREVFRFIYKSQSMDKYSLFDARCDILLLATKLTEEQIYKYSDEEIELMVETIYQELNKKK